MERKRGRERGREHVYDRLANSCIYAYDRFVAAGGGIVAGRAG